MSQPTGRRSPVGPIGRALPDLTRIGRRIPSPLVEWLGSAYVAQSTARNRNVFEYDHDGETFEYEYDDFATFGYLYRCITGGRTRHEGIPLEVFDLSPAFDAVVDVGAHFGLYSVILGVLNPETPLFAFEPNDRNAAVLRANLERNDIRATVENAAVTGAGGDVEFFEHATAHNAHTTTREGAAGDFSVTRATSKRLSTLLEAGDIRTPFVKLDAEGEEETILPDLLEEAEFDRLSGILEIHPERMSTDPEDLFALLEDHGVAYAPIKRTEKTPAYYISTFEDVERQCVHTGADAGSP